MKKKTNTLLIGFGLMMASVFVSSNLSLESASAHTLTITTNNSINLDVTPHGTGTSIKTESINVASTCRSGYNLSISTPEGSDLYRYDSTNDTFDSTASFTAVDGTSALSSASNTNKWGYTLTSNASTSTIFSPLSATTTVLKTYSQTASPSSDINDTFNINYGVKVDSTITPGNYQMANHGAIVYYATVEPTCLNYTVQYQDGGADNPNGMGTTDSSTGEKSVKQINISEGTTINLLPPNFKKQGHSFLGWSTDQNAYTHFTDNDNTNDPVIYGPMETVTIDSTLIASANTRNQINMYPVWLPALRTDPSNENSTPVYFQDWDNSNTTLPHDGCSTLTQTVFDDTETNEKDKIKVTKNSVVALTDKRDNEVYTVARLADGKCWMTENLRLDAEYTMGQNQNDSTVTNQYLSQGYGGTTGTYGSFVGLAEAESANFAANPVANSVYKSAANPPVDTYDPINEVLEDIGTIDYPAYHFPRYNNINNSNALSSPTYIENYTNAASPSTSGIYKTSKVSSYGNYYSWAAAMANTNHYTSPSVSEAVGTSICPSGWHLPSGYDATREYGTLSQGYGGNGNNQSGVGTGDIINNRFRTFPNNFLYSGRFYTSDMDKQGLNGLYWSRSANGQVSSHNLDLYSTGLNPIESNHRYYGFSVRCLVSATDVEITLDSNNGTNAVSRVYGAPNASITLPSSSIPSASIAQPGYGFKEWNTAPNGSGITYTTSYTIPAGSTGETLYVQWMPQYTIVYANNCMSWAIGDANCNQTKSDTTSTQRINLDTSGNGSGTLGAYNKFTMTGWKIKEWATNADGTGTTYPISSTYSVIGASAGDSITLYAHWEPVYTVQYDGNGSDNDSTGMGSTNATTGIKTVNHYNVAEGNSFVLFASNFKRAGYGFVGWSLDSNAWSKLTDNDATNDVKIWGPNEIFTAPAPNGTPITTLYAIWAPAEQDGNNDPVYLQGWTGCSAMTATVYNSATGKLTVANNSVTALTDQRDGQVYAVAKLADDNCWIIENLRLGDVHQESGNTVATTLSTTNTNILPSNNTLPITNIYNADPSLATTSNSLSPTSSAAYNASSAPYGWCTDKNTACYDQSRLNTTNTTSNATPSKTQNITSSFSSTGIGTEVYAYGNYYNWYSATAGYGTYSKSSGVVDGDLCPAGWHMPYGGSGTGNKGGNTSGGFGYLANRMAVTSADRTNSNKFRTFPNNLIHSGYWSGGLARTRGDYGYYWSATAYDSNAANSLYIDSGRVFPSDVRYNKHDGNTVRCVTSPAS